MIDQPGIGACDVEFGNLAAELQGEPAAKPGIGDHVIGQQDAAELGFFARRQGDSLQQVTRGQFPAIHQDLTLRRGLSVAPQHKRRQRQREQRIWVGSGIHFPASGCDTAATLYPSGLGSS